MELILPTVWSLFLGFSGLMCYFGVRNGQGMSSPLAFVCGIVLMASAGFALYDMGRVAEGYPANGESNFFTLASLVFSLVKLPEWAGAIRGG